MGFFKNLKKKLLNLDTTEKDDVEKKKSISQENAQLEKAKSKLEKKLVHEQRKQIKLSNYVSGLKKSNAPFINFFKELQTRHNVVNEDFFEELEEVLIMADISPSLVSQIVFSAKKESKLKNIYNPKELIEVVFEIIYIIYTSAWKDDNKLNFKENRLNIFIMTGVNGSGKTTSIAKIANRFNKENKKVLIAAADTFRAGAVEQLSIWAERIGISIVKPVKEQADPASVVFDAIKKAKSENYDLLIIDTAGRLQNKVNLMNELSKMVNIITREVPDAPHEALLVIDATSGQNGVNQAASFKEASNITGIVLTKMDGTSKGGIVLTIREKLGIPVKFIGLGEKLDDLQDFDVDAFIYGLTQGLGEE